MFSRFLPKEPGFFDSFDQHADLIVRSAQLLSTIWGNHSIVTSVEKIKSLENEADEITHHTIELLHKTFITPLDREDIFRLISRMDDIIDHIEAAADCLIVYKITSLLTPALSLVKILNECAQEVQSAVKGLRHIDKNPSTRLHCTKINLLESEADGILRNAIGLLFEEEQDTRLLIKWKEIYDHLEGAINRCEDASNIIEGVILEHM